MKSWPPELKIKWVTVWLPLFQPHLAQPLPKVVRHCPFPEVHLIHNTFHKIAKFIKIFWCILNLYWNTKIISSWAITISWPCKIEYILKIVETRSQQLHSTFHRPYKIIKISKCTHYIKVYNTIFWFWAKTICVSHPEARAFQTHNNFLLYPKSVLVLKLS
jgi:hypothetical protein